MNILFDEVGTPIRGHVESDDYSISLVDATALLSAGTPHYEQVNDLTYTRVDGVGAIIKKNIVGVTALTNPKVTFSSDTPAVCSVDADGVVTRVANGTCTVTTSGKTGRRKVSQEISEDSTSASVYTAATITGVGSLREYLEQQQFAALAGVSPGYAEQRAHVGPNAVVGFGTVNEMNFLLNSNGKAGYDGLPLDALREILAGPGGYTSWRAWISPHHFITWKGHLPPETAATWMRIGSEIVVEYSATRWDGALVKLLPPDAATYIPPQITGDLYGQYFSIENIAVGTEICCWARLFNTYDGYANDDPLVEKRWLMPTRFIWHNPFSSGDIRRAYQRYMTSPTDWMVSGGDSGSPVFCGINGELVLLSHVRWSGTVGYDLYYRSVDSINAAMNSLAETNGDPNGGTYAVEHPTLVGVFTAY